MKQLQHNKIPEMIKSNKEILISINFTTLVHIFFFFLSFLMEKPAYSQSFNYQPFTGQISVDLNIDDDELVWDVAHSEGPGAPYPRYAPNLDYRRRIVANPYFTSASLTFSKLQLNPTVREGVSDSVSLKWRTSEGTTTGLVGTMASGSALNVGPTAGFSMMCPGLELRFVSGPSLSPDPSQAALPTAMMEAEESGFTTHQITLNSTGTPASGAPPGTCVSAIRAHEQITGILLANDDVIHMRLPERTTDSSVALWLQDATTATTVPPGTTPTATNLVKVWARCNEIPDPTVEHMVATGTMAGQTGAFLHLPAADCPGGAWFVSVTNESSANRVFHLTAGTHYPNQDFGNTNSALRVGISFNATEAEGREIASAFRTAAWMLYGATGGAIMIREFEFFNEATECSQGVFQDEFACGGTSCQFCLHPGCTRSNSNFVGKITMCDSDGPERFDESGTKIGKNLPQWLSPWVLVHEIGHAYLDLRDNYHNVNLTCPRMRPGTWPLCGHSIMSGYGQNAFFCTRLGHKTNLIDWRGQGRSGSLPMSAFPRGINGPESYSCFSYRFFTNHDADWTAINARAPEQHPLDITPNNYDYHQFWGNNAIGRPTFN